MFTYFYFNKIYRFWKSGFLLDFFLKKLIFYVLYTIFYYFNILFSEKYFIEHTFLKILKYIDLIKNNINIFLQHFSIYQVGVVFIITFTIVVLTVIV